MIQFFIVYLYDIPNNEFISFSTFDGSSTPVVILDDGWNPNITKYVRNGEKTWSDVVEEVECMTNVSTRDEALELLEKINALIHRAARDIEEKQEYTVYFAVRSQFSSAPNSAFTYVISPPDDGNVITLSTDIQTAPPGQVKFKLRFKRTGAWITSFSDTTTTGTLTSDINPPSGYWKLQTTLPTNITIPTPISLEFSFTAQGLGSFNVDVEQIFMCVNVINSYIVKNITNLDVVNYPSWRYAYLDYGYAVLSNKNPYDPFTAPQSVINLNTGTYAIFLAWRSVLANVPHRLKILFDNYTEIANTLLLAPDASPHYHYFGTVKMTTPAKKLYLGTTIGHSTGFEIEKILFVELNSTSTIINLQNWVYAKNAIITINNSLLEPIKSVVQSWTVDQTQLRLLLSTYDSIDTVADNKIFTVVAIGNSPDLFSLRTYPDYYRVDEVPVTITYRPVRTTFH